MTDLMRVGDERLMRLPWVIRVWRRVFCMTIDSDFDFEEEITQHDLNVSLLILVCDLTLLESLVT